jgi:hypothetical protein
MYPCMHTICCTIAWNRSHSEDKNRSPTVVMPMYAQLAEFYNLINISGTGYMRT